MNSIEKSRALGDRLINFAAQVVQLLDNRSDVSLSSKFAAQLVRCVSSIGANYEEAQAAESKADFIHKLQIALKESRETCYWLKLLRRLNQLPAEQNSLFQESTEIRAILTKAVITSKQRYS